jgi:hypothetical protein
MLYVLSAESEMVVKDSGQAMIVHKVGTWYMATTTRLHTWKGLAAGKKLLPAEGWWTGSG